MVVSPEAGVAKLLLSRFGFCCTGGQGLLSDLRIAD
jgi:hypothetical protein